MNPVFLTTTTCECRVTSTSDQQGPSTSCGGCTGTESSGEGGVCPKCMVDKVPALTSPKEEPNANVDEVYNSNYKSVPSVIIVSRRGSGSGEGGSMVLADDVKNKLCTPVRGTYKYPST